MGQLPGEQHLHSRRAAALCAQRAYPHASPDNGYEYLRPHENTYPFPGNFHPDSDAIPVLGDAYPYLHAHTFRNPLAHGKHFDTNTYSTNGHLYAYLNVHSDADTGNRHP